jgi:tetratricopeptide (TPR) repeat protein
MGKKKKFMETNGTKMTCQTIAGIFVFVFSFFTVPLLVSGQPAELSDYKWVVFKNVKSTIELPNEIANFDWEPKNDPGFVNEGIRPNNKKQYSFILNNPKAKFFQLILNESTPKGIRTHIVTLIVSEEDFDPTTHSSNRRFRTDKDITDAMAFQSKSEANPAPKPKAEPASPTVPQVVKKPEPAPRQIEPLEEKIAAADKLFKAQDLKGAETLYKEALQIDRSNPHILAQLDIIKGINAKFAQELESLEIRQKTYQDNLAKAEDYFKRSEWAMARFYYKEALKYATNPQIVNDQLIKVEQKENEQRQIESKFNNYKTKAVEASQNKDFVSAINNWEEALKVKPGDANAKAELENAKIKLQEKVAEDLRLQKLYAERKLEDEFLTQLGKSDIALRNNDFETSRREVAKAAEIKPNDPRVGQKMDFIDKTEIKYKEQQAALATKEKELRYNNLISNAQKQYNAGKFLEAINLYEQAQGEKPSDPYPGQQIKSIIEKQESLAKEAELKKLEAQKAALQLEVNKKVAAGDKALAANNFTEAENAFLEANKLDPENPYPIARLKLIDEKRQAYEAKLAADKQREEAQRIIKFKYDSVMALADAYIAKEQFDLGISALEEALKIKQNDHEASGKLALVNKKKQEARERQIQMERIAKENALDSLEGLGTQSIVAGDYYAAREYFRKASTIFPEPSGYTKSQLRHIEVTIGENEKMEAAAQKEFNFSRLVKTADSAILEGNLDLALEAATKANTIIVDDPKVSSILFRLTDPEERKRLDMHAQRVYSNKLVDTAQTLYQEKKYAESLALLDKASQLWPQNNRIEFLRNQAVEGLTGVPTNLQTKAEIKFSFEKNPGFRRSGNPTTAETNNTQTTAIPIAVKQEAEKAVKETQMNPAGETPVKKDSAVTIAQAGSVIAADTLPTAAQTMKEVVEAAKVDAVAKEEAEKSLSDSIAQTTTNNSGSLPSGLTIQKIGIPYDSVVLAEKFPNIDFAKPPYGQKFSIDFYNESEKEMNAEKSVEILAGAVNLPVRDSADQILVHLDNLSFGVYNSYYRISISNYSNKDFAVGYIMLTVERKNGESTNYEPSYISAFPVVIPMHQASFVYTTRQIQLNSEDKIILNIFERKTNARFTIALPGELYNNEYDK